MPIETPSDRDFACFICAEGKAKDVKESCPKCGSPLDVGREFIGQTVAGFKLEDYVNRGFYGATLRATNLIGRLAAVKLVPSKLYENQRKDFYDEIARYRLICPHPQIADLYDAGQVDLPLFGRTINFYYIIMEWVDGRELADFIRVEPINASIVFGAILDLTSAISRFESQNLWHNDLNGSNILVKALAEEEIPVRRSESPFSLKVVDSGSAVFRRAFQQQTLNDLTFLGQHINSLRSAALQHRQGMSREDQFFLDNLEPIASSLLDENPARRLPTAASVLQAVRKLFDERFSLSGEPEIKLNSAFDYLNANDFPNESFVNRLFSSRFPWIQDIIGPAAQSILITGPRGSGKTMILRSMRLKARLAPSFGTESSADIRKRVLSEEFIGFFISARLEIGNYAPLTKIPAWMDSEELTLYYFHLLYAYEVCETLHYARIKQIFFASRTPNIVFANFCHPLLTNWSPHLQPPCLC